MLISEHTSKALLERGLGRGFADDVVSVQWALGAEPPFKQAVANARLVALEINFFLDKMRFSNSLPGDKIHIIGHGLGAHIAGYVGKMRFINTITALDPTGPYFMKMPSQVRLHKFDARFVEVVHTDDYPSGQGYPFNMGHADYYPNGGKKQPGCIDEYYELSSITRNDVKGKCASCGEDMQNCRRLTNVESRNLGVFNPYAYYFVTSQSAPFCAEVIKAVLVLKPELSFVMSGYFNVTIPQKSKDVSFLLNENQYYSSLVLHEQHFYLVFRTVPPSLTEPVESVSIEWVPTGMRSFLFPPPSVQALVIHKISDRPAPWPGWLCVHTSQTTNRRVNYNLQLCKSDLKNPRPPF